MEYNLNVIRKLIDAAFGSEDLETFCFDHFNAVYKQFTAGQLKDARIRMLVEHVERNGLFEKLLDEIKAINSYQYSRFEQQLENKKQTSTTAAQTDHTSGRTSMQIDQTLMNSLRNALMDCDEFQNPGQLTALFNISELKPWQAGLPQANALSRRVDMTIDYLLGKYRTGGENALVILLNSLGLRYDPADERHGRLSGLANQLRQLNKDAPEPTVEVETPKSGDDDSEPDVYISCAESDLDTGKRIYNDLHKAGLKPWMEAIDLKPGRDAKKTVRGVIENCEYFLALLSSKSLSAKGLVQKEQKDALSIFEEFPPDEIFIIPVRIDDCKPSDDTLRGLKSVDLFKSYEDGLEQILRVVG